MLCVFMFFPFKYSWTSYIFLREAPTQSSQRANQPETGEAADASLLEKQLNFSLAKSPVSAVVFRNISLWYSKNQNWYHGGIWKWSTLIVAQSCGPDWKAAYWCLDYWSAFIFLQYLYIKKLYWMLLVYWNYKVLWYGQVNRNPKVQNQPNY